MKTYILWQSILQSNTVTSLRDILNICRKDWEWILRRWMRSNNLEAFQASSFSSASLFWLPCCRVCIFQQHIPRAEQMVSHLASWILVILTTDCVQAGMEDDILQGINVERKWKQLFINILDFIVSFAFMLSKCPFFFVHGHLFNEFTK